MKKTILFSFYVFSFSLVFAAAPDLINYQGKLADSSGNPVTATRDVTIAVYDSGPGAGGNLTFEETHSNVSIVNGVFSLQIGGGALNSGNLKTALADEDGAWLQITVGGSVMSPRQKLASVPYALMIASGTSVSNLAPGTFPAGTYSFGGNGKIADLQDPTLAQDAATKNYVDTYGVPSGAVMFFNLASCPSGWTELTDAQGRVILGLPASGSLAASSGTALGDLGARTISDVPAHQHEAGTLAAEEAGSHTHGFTTYFDTTDVGGRVEAAGTSNGNWTAYTSSNGNHTHIISGVTASTGTAMVNVTMPYIQLLCCQKD